MVDKPFTAPNMDSGSLDDIDDLPEFKTPPSGAYKVEFTEGFVKKVINNHPAEELEMKLLEILEYAEPPKEGEEAAVGMIFNTAFMMDNAVGAGKYKEVAKEFATKLGTKDIAAIRAGSKGMVAVVAIHKQHDEKKDRHYANIKNIAFV